VIGDDDRLAGLGDPIDELHHCSEVAAEVLAVVYTYTVDTSSRCGQPHPAARTSQL
jgi:hypothetical protein